MDESGTIPNIVYLILFLRGERVNESGFEF